MTKRSADHIDLSAEEPVAKIVHVDEFDKRYAQLVDENASLRYQLMALREEVDYWKRMYGAAMHSALWRKNRGIVLADIDEESEEESEEENDESVLRLCAQDTDVESNSEEVLDSIFSDFIE